MDLPNGAPEPIRTNRPPPLNPDLDVDTAVSALQIASLERIDRPPGPFHAFVAELTSRAASGDARAAYQLFLAYDYCRIQPSTQGSLDSAIAKASTDRIYLDNELFDPLPRIEALQAGFEYCRGAPTENPEQVHEWLRVAARAGLLPAQLTLGTTPPPGDFDLASEGPEERKRIAEARAEGMRWRQAAADAGSVEAYSWLAHSYHRGVMVERDAVKAYAYQLAAVEARRAAGDARRMHAEFLANLGAELHGYQIEEAERLAAAILASPECCKL